MATGVLQEYSGMGEDKYQRIVELLGPNTNPKGVILHLAAKTPNGFRVVDIWDSRNSFDQFYRDHLTPIFGKLGIQSPRTEYFDIVNVMTADVSALNALNKLGTLTGARR